MRPGGAQRRVDQHERLTTSEPPSAPPDTRMGESQGILLRLRRSHPHTKPQPHGRRARESGDSRGPGQTNRPSATTAQKTCAQRHPPSHERPDQHEHNRTTARRAPSTRNRAPGQPTRPGTTRRKPRFPEKPHLPRTLPPAVKSKCRVSLSRGSVRFERGGPHAV